MEVRVSLGPSITCAANGIVGQCDNAMVGPGPVVRGFYKIYPAVIPGIYFPPLSRTLQSTQFEITVDFGDGSPPTTWTETDNVRMHKKADTLF